MSYVAGEYDVIVIGAGHAGVEAAWRQRVWDVKRWC